MSLARAAGLATVLAILLAACTPSNERPATTAGPAASAVAARSSAVAGCATDADCRLFSNYCGGCACAALGTTAPEPHCAKSEVQCFADPCRRARATCVSGACKAVEPSTSM
jgi:hypothetical protein